MMSLVLLFILTFAKLQVHGIGIEEKVQSFFDGSEAKLLENVWEKLRPSYENAIATSLRETFGSPAGTMNVYIRRKNNPQNLQRGYYFTDNVVNVLLQNLYLRELPRMYSPDVSFPLHHNVIRVESLVSKIFADADYVVFRNRSDLVFNGTAQKSTSEHSPFSFQQVQSDGILTIIGEDCHLVGQAVVTLVGVSVHVGHTTFQLSNCKFSIEIYQPNFQSPPVIAPYFTKEQCIKLERTISTALDEELRSVLGGILYSHLNTTAMYATNMPKIRRKQKYVFQDSADFMAQVVRHLNKDILSTNKGTVTMPGTDLVWDNSLDEENPRSKTQSSLTLTELTMNGLDRLYHSNRGGPIITVEHQIMDELRLDKLQVRGRMAYVNDTSNPVAVLYDFSVELDDVAIAVKVKLGISSGKKSGRREEESQLGGDTADAGPNRDTGDAEEDTANENSGDIQKLNSDSAASERSVRQFKVTGWRFLEFTSNDYLVYVASAATIPSYAFISGHLVTALPETIEKELKDKFESAIRTADTVDYSAKRKLKKRLGKLTQPVPKKSFRKPR